MLNKFEEILKIFRQQITYEIRYSCDDLHDKIGNEIRKFQSGEFGLAVIKIVEIRGEHLQKIGDKAIQIFIENLELYKSKPISKNEINQICKSIESDLVGICKDCRSSLKAYAASKGMERHYTWDKYWIHKELEGRIVPILEKLRIDIQKYNAHPFDL